MAAYSENRDIALEIKQLRKTLAGVDRNITLPDSLRGEALLQKLEGVQQDLPPMGKALMMPKKWRSRSGLAIAAAFLLMIGLVYGINFNRQGSLEYGEISLAQDALGTADTQPANGPVQNGPAVGQDVPAPPEATPRTFAVPGEGGNGDNPAVGGSGQATAIAEDFYGYTLVYRENDSTDPDRATPCSLELLEGNALADWADLPGMDRVLYSFTEDTAIAVVGDSRDDVALYRAVLTQGEIADGNVIIQPGAIQNAWVSDGILRVITTGEPTADMEQHAALSGGSQALILTALRLEDGEFHQIAVPADVKNIKVEGNRATVTYHTASGEEKKTEIIFRGLDLDYL